MENFSFRDIVENSQDIIVVTKSTPIDDDSLEIVYVNKAFVDLTGYTAEEALDKNPRFLQGHDTSEETRAEVKHSLAKQRPIRTTIKNYSKGGRAY